MMKFATIGFVACEAVSAADYYPRPQVTDHARGDHLDHLVKLHSTTSAVEPSTTNNSAASVVGKVGAPQGHFYYAPPLTQEPDSVQQNSKQTEKEVVVQEEQNQTTLAEPENDDVATAVVEEAVKAAVTELESELKDAESHDDAENGEKKTETASVDDDAAEDEETVNGAAAPLADGAIADDNLEIASFGGESAENFVRGTMSSGKKARDEPIIFFDLTEENAIWNTLRDLGHTAIAEKLHKAGENVFEEKVTHIVQECHFQNRANAQQGEHVPKLTMAALIDEHVFDAVMAYHGTSLEIQNVCSALGRFHNMRGGSLIDNVWDEIAGVVAKHLAEGGLVDFARIAASKQCGRSTQQADVLAVLEPEVVVDVLESSEVEQVIQEKIDWRNANFAPPAPRPSIVLCRALLPHGKHIELEPKFIRQVAAALASKCDDWVRQQEWRELAETLLADEAVANALEPVFRVPLDYQREFDWEEIEASGKQVPRAHWAMLLANKNEGCLRYQSSMDAFRRFARNLHDPETPEGVARTVRIWWRDTGHWYHHKLASNEVSSAPKKNLRGSSSGTTATIAALVTATVALLASKRTGGCSRLLVLARRALGC